MSNRADASPLRVKVRNTFLDVECDESHAKDFRRRRSAPVASPMKLDDDEDDDNDDDSDPLGNRYTSRRNTGGSDGIDSTDFGLGSLDAHHASMAWNQGFNYAMPPGCDALGVGMGGGYPYPPWEQPELQQDVSDADHDAYVTELELKAAELKLAALRAEAAAQQARTADAKAQQTSVPSNRLSSSTHFDASARPFVPPGMNPAEHFQYFPNPYLASAMPPMWPPHGPGMPYPSMHHPLGPGYQPDSVGLNPHQWWHQSKQQTRGEPRPRHSAPQDSQSEQDYTTVMLRNLPNDYTRDMLLELLEMKGFGGCFDFLYLPFDFKKHAGLGYAFMNLITHDEAMRAMRELQGFSEWKVITRKVLQISWSTPLQGLAANIERYRNSPVMHPDVPEQFKPLLFKHGATVRFPPPTKEIPRPEFKGSLA